MSEGEGTRRGDVIASVYGTNMVCVRSGGVYAAMGIAKRSVLP